MCVWHMRTQAHTLVNYLLLQNFLTVDILKLRFSIKLQGYASCLSGGFYSALLSKVGLLFTVTVVTSLFLYVAKGMTNY
jgi:hypothetical protein